MATLRIFQNRVKNTEIEKKKSKKMSPIRKEELFQAYSFITPAVIVISLFSILPIFAAILASFMDVNLIADKFDLIALENYKRMFNTPSLESFSYFLQSFKSVFDVGIFSGLENIMESFFKIFFRDIKYIKALMNTFKYVIFVVPIQTILAMIMASVLNSGVKGQKAFRILYFLPTLTSSAALTLIFMWIFNAQGLLNIILIGLGQDPKMWLTDVNLVLKVIMAMNVWASVPFYMTIYLAGMQDINTSQYESAKIDGANAIQRFRYITIPHLKPITTFVVLMGIIGCFQMFDQAFIISDGSGGPANSTLTVVLLIYQYAFKYNTIGYASVMALILAIIIVIASYISKKLNSGNEESIY